LLEAQGPWPYVAVVKSKVAARQQHHAIKGESKR
jgi:hypothetical protein